MLKVIQLEEIETLLLQLPTFVREQAERSVEFPGHVAEWLAALEATLVACRLHQAASIAALHSELVAVDLGNVPAEIRVRGRPTRSKLLSAMASGCLKRAAEVVTPLAAENRTRFSEAERVLSQVVAAAFSSGLIEHPDDKADISDYLRRVRTVLATRPEVAAAFVHVQGLVGPNDLLILLDRVTTSQRRMPE